MFLVRFLLSVIQSEGPQESEQFGFTQLDSIQARGMRGRFSPSGRGGLAVAVRVKGAN
jgi:hypothetical protein